MTEMHQNIEKRKTISLIAGRHINAIVNHSYNFVDPSTYAHTQNIERLWGSVKWRNKCRRGTARYSIWQDLCEGILIINTNSTCYFIILQNIGQHELII